MRLQATCPIALAALLLAGCGGDPASQHAAYERNAQHTRATLVMAGDPDSLEAAAFYGRLWGDEPAERLALVERAASAAPDRPDIAWLQIQLCTAVPTCDLKPVEEHLRRIDPGNGAVWAGSLERVSVAGDTTALKALIGLIADSQRFDMYWNSTIAHVADALIHSRQMDPRTALMGTIGVGAAQLVPFQPLAQACRGPALQDPDTLSTCRRLVQVMRRGDSVITEMFGLTLAKRVWPEDSAEYQEATRARSVMLYRMNAAAKAEERMPSDDAAAERYLALLGKLRTEQDVVLAQLASVGVSTNPGAGSAAPRPKAE